MYFPLGALAQAVANKRETSQQQPGTEARGNGLLIISLWHWHVQQAMAMAHCLLTVYPT
jgi:hypothetical protein